MPRRAGKFRSQLVVTAPERGRGQAVARTLVCEAERIPSRGDLKWSIDIDPLDIF
jgi:primosomal protein N' (replication factor Y)